jgi:hypothetical protein
MKHIAATLILLGLVSAAWADEGKGFYIGAGVGQFNVEADNIDEIGPIVQEFDSDSTSFEIFAGWKFNKFISAEAAYLDYGSPDENIGGVNVKADISGAALFLVGTLPIGPLEVYGKVGYLMYDLDVDVGNQKVDAASGGEDDPIYGVGLGMVLFKKLEARLEYQYLDSNRLDKSDALWLAAAWRF